MTEVLSPPSSSSPVSPPVISPSSSSSSSAKLTPSCFVPSLLLGEGSYSQVYLVESLIDHRRYAMKVLNKAHLHRHHRSSVALCEKNALNRCHHPFIVTLYHTFQDTQSLYFILELCEGGDVFNELCELGCYPLDVSRFYAAELLLCLHYLHHTAHIAHRDLKPENIMLTTDRHMKLVDFGCSKIIQPHHHNTETLSHSINIDSVTSPSNKKKKHSFVGTAEYVAPEMLQHGDEDHKTPSLDDNNNNNNNDDGSASYGIDLWAAGCVVYQMLVGHPPFQAASEYLIFQRILQHQLNFPDDMNIDAKQLIEQLMHRQPQHRLGCKAEDWEKIVHHPFFEGHIDFTTLTESTPPPLPRSIRKKQGSVLHEDSLVAFQTHNSSKLGQPRGSDTQTQQEEEKTAEESNAADRQKEARQSLDTVAATAISSQRVEFSSTLALNGTSSSMPLPPTIAQRLLSTETVIASAHVLLQQQTSTDKSASLHNCFYGLFSCLCVCSSTSPSRSAPPSVSASAPLVLCLTSMPRFLLFSSAAPNLVIAEIEWNACVYATTEQTNLLVLHTAHTEYSMQILSGVNNSQWKQEIKQLREEQQRQQEAPR